MNRRLQVQVRTVSRDAAGGRTESWADTYKAWAEEVRPKSSESIEADAERSVETRFWRIRWRSDIASDTHRITHGGNTFDILGITEEGIKDRLLLECRAVQSLSL